VQWQRHAAPEGPWTCLAARGPTHSNDAAGVSVGVTTHAAGCTAPWRPLSCACALETARPAR
jgi:hypothetical protein